LAEGFFFGAGFALAWPVFFVSGFCCFFVSVLAVFWGFSFFSGAGASRSTGAIRSLRIRLASLLFPLTTGVAAKSLSYDLSGLGFHGFFGAHSSNCRSRGGVRLDAAEAVCFFFEAALAAGASAGFLVFFDFFLV